MPLLTYQQARPCAKEIKDAVLSKKMPPWFADAHYGPYLNDKSLSQHDVETLVSWADAGAPEGNPKDAPAAVAWPESWSIKRDIVVDGPVTQIPAAPKANVIPWMTVIMPTGFAKDTWVTTMEILPSAPAVTARTGISQNRSRSVQRLLKQEPGFDRRTPWNEIGTADLLRVHPTQKQAID